MKTRETNNEGQKISFENENDKPFGKLNFIGMAASAVLIIVGFLLMLGSGSTFEEFNPDIFSTRRIVIGPLLTFLGFVGMAVAIILNPARMKK